jgi:hypothetical protein
LTGNNVIPILSDQNPRISNLSNLARSHPHALGGGIKEVLVRLTDGGGKAGDGEYMLRSDGFCRRSVIIQVDERDSECFQDQDPNQRESEKESELQWGLAVSSERNHRITR